MFTTKGYLAKSDQHTKVFCRALPESIKFRVPDRELGTYYGGKLISEIVLTYFRHTPWIFEMLCLYAWLGGLGDLKGLANQESQTKVELPLFGRLNGKYLGNLVVPKHVDQACIHAVLTDLQRQAHKLMPHEWRPLSHVLLQVGDRNLLAFGSMYKHDLNITKRLESSTLLKRCMQPSDPTNKHVLKQEFKQDSKRITMMYDDNDAYATKVLQAHGLAFSRRVLDNHKVATLTIRGTFASMPSILVGLCNDYEASCVRIEYSGEYVLSRDLSFVAKLSTRNVTLCRVVPSHSSWSSLCHLVELCLENVYVPPEISKLVGLKILKLDHIVDLPDTLMDLHLHMVSLRLSSMSIVFRLLNLLAEMASLSELSLVDNNTLFRFGSFSIPSELGSMKSLTRLTIRNNNFEGSIPSELGYLTNLTDLMICERLNVDMRIPEEVLALQHTKTKLDIIYFGG